MTEATKTQELFVETLALWSEAGRRVLAEVVELGAATARENLKLYGELQRSAIDALRQGQATAEQAGRHIQETLAGTVTKMKEIYAAS
jgi:hypothetical protein